MNGLRAPLTVHLKALRSALLKSRGRRRANIRREIKEQRLIIDTARDRLAQSKIAVHVAPIAGLEWYLALTLWFFNSSCWFVWFGTRSNIDVSTALELRAPNRDQPENQLLQLDCKRCVCPILPPIIVM